MAMKLLTARRISAAPTGPGTLHFVVHLDTTKNGDDGNPDPAWTMTADWSYPGLQQAETPAQMAARLIALGQACIPELRLAAQAALAAMTPAAGTALAQEGQAL